MSTSATLPPYTTLHSENPPPYTPGPGTGPEGEEEEERSRAQVEAAGHGEYVPAPALLDQDVREPRSLYICGLVNTWWAIAFVYTCLYYCSLSGGPVIDFVMT